MRISTRFRTSRSVLAFAAVIMCITASAWAGETVLYSFPGGPNGSDPSGALAMDSSGNLYGTTISGGISTNNGGCGTVFELSPASGGGYTEAILYTFQATSTTDGCLPYSGVTVDSAGNLYGTTAMGGSGGAACVDGGCGTVYELVRGSDGAWTEKILWNFTYGEDGANPTTNVVFDSKGNAYGTTTDGGNDATCGSSLGIIGCGTVYKLTPTSNGEWQETTLVEFPDSRAQGASFLAL
jgi:uncharacterized repeat protein (TIGR03803 family)